MNPSFLLWCCSFKLINIIKYIKKMKHTIFLSNYFFYQTSHNKSSNNHLNCFLNDLILFSEQASNDSNNHV